MDNSEVKSDGIIHYEKKEHVGILTIHNGIQNKIPQPDFLDLDFFKEWLSKQKIKGLIITGQGRHFSAGADVNNITTNKDNIDCLKEALKRGKDILSYIESLPLITVAAISGVCFGAGLEIALSCQFRICTKNAVLAFPESNLGIMPGLSGTIRLPRKIGKSKAIELLISGRTVDSEEAYNLGLIDNIVPNKSHLETAISFVHEVTNNKSHMQIESIIESVNNAIYEDNEIAMDYEGETFVKLVKNM